MSMFSRKICVLFIGRRFIEPGVVTLGHEPVFDGQEALTYTEETFPESLRQVATTICDSKRIRVVLGEELVYVTELSFSGKTPITRELVLAAAEQSIPEDVRKTDWDFRTLRYAKKQNDREETLVQVAVVKKSFADAFHRALTTQPLPIECVLPESYVLAGLEKGTAGISLLVERDRETTLLCAVENGFVIATRVEEGAPTTDMMEAFLVFLAVNKGKNPETLILSHLDETEQKSLVGFFGERYRVIARDYNPLIGAVLQENISGKDEDVLNIDVFSSLEKKHWWKFF